MSDSKNDTAMKTHTRNFDFGTNQPILKVLRASKEEYFFGMKYEFKARLICVN